MSKTTIACIAPADVHQTALEVSNELPFSARRLRTIAQVLNGDVGDALAGCDRSDEVYPYFEIMLDAIRTEPARLEKYSEQLFASQKAVA